MLSVKYVVESDVAIAETPVRRHRFAIYTSLNRNSTITKDRSENAGNPRFDTAKCESMNVLSMD
ncbi:hypothetical protein RRSWK_06147 [Rhodopirellula sp. SWK7]|nr:hypothetical protein RRSWK_06147 [Rhodopirellula sp. SWK7]